jgi:glycosyltransferase A (GT-A) superfamily protein (DUF2064 family)
MSAAARGPELSVALRGGVTRGQRGPDLGHRIAAAHRAAAALLPGRPVLQIGMDTPQVDPALLAEAGDRLRHGADAVLGPAADGGWWALGLRDPRHAVLVRSVRTSCADTGERTLDALRKAGLRVRLLPELRDVDTFTDAVAVAAAVPGTRFAAAVTDVAAPAVAQPC